MIKYTFCIPMYNGAAYLKECIDSIKSQTFTNFRVLIINDGSTDSSLSILNDTIDDRFTIITRDNKGLKYTLNELIDLCDTEWIIRMDIDDICAPNRLERINQVIEESPELGMIYSGAALISENGIRLGRFKGSRGDHDQLRRILDSGYLISICHPSVAYRSDKVRSIGKYLENSPIEDIEMWTRLVPAVDVRYIDEELVYYRIVKNSISNKNIKEQFIRTIILQYKIHFRNGRIKILSDSKLIELLDNRKINKQIGCRILLRETGSIESKTKKLFVFAKAFMLDPKYFISRAFSEINDSKPVKIGFSIGELNEFIDGK